MRVVAQVQFANKASTSDKPENRLKYNKLAYVEAITSIVTLPNPGKDLDANAQLWAADNGKLALSALTLAFGNIEKLIPRTLALTDADVKTMNGKDKPNTFAGGFRGRLQETSTGHQLLWSNGFIEADTLPLDQ